MVNRIIEDVYFNERTGKVSADWLNVLNGVNKDAKIVGILERGSSVRVLSRVNGYYAIEYGLGRGFINSEYIDFAS